LDDESRKQRFILANSIRESQAIEEIEGDEREVPS
jgi:hypothetical protein